MSTRNCVSQSCPIVFPTSTTPGPKGDKGDAGAASTVAGPAGADNAAVLLNTVATPFTLTTAVTTVVATYATTANQMAAGDVLEGEMLLAVPVVYTGKVTVGVNFSDGSTVISVGGGEVNNIDHVSDIAVPPSPTYKFVRYSFKVLFKTVALQYGTKETEVLGTNTNYRFAPTALSSNFGGVVTIEAQVTLSASSTGVMVYYTTLIHYKKV